MIDLEIQLACDGAQVPGEARFRQWAEAALQDKRDEAELVIRVVDETESAELNGEYRGKDYPTNVLSFPFEAPPACPAAISAIW